MPGKRPVRGDLPSLDDVIRSTPIGLGGAPLGNLYAALDDGSAQAVVRTAWATGIRYFDTAPHYGNGLSERRMGRALHDFPRNEYVLSSKVGRLLEADASAPHAQNGYVDVLPFRQRFDYSRDGTLRSIDQSLRRLATDRLDIVFVHDIDVATHGDAQPQRFREAMQGGLRALAELKDAGAIRGYGLGVNDWRVCMDALAHADFGFILLAGRYTLLDQTGLPLLSECGRRGIRVVVGGPYNSGILATGAHAPGGAPRFDYAAAPAAIVDRVARIEATCDAHGVQLRAAALQFPRAHPAVVNVLAGARSAAEVEENAQLAAVPIADAFWRALRNDGLLPEAAPLPCDVRE